MKVRIIFFLLLLFSLISSFVFGQKLTKIQGQVIEDETGQPLEFVNVYFSGTNIGTLTDEDGKFEIETLWAKAFLEAGMMGYKTTKIPIKLGEKQTLIIRLESQTIKLNSVTVSAKKRVRRKENPAIPIIMKTVKNRKSKSIKNLASYQFRQYEQLSYAFSNIIVEEKPKGVLKVMPELKNFIDTSEISGKPYVPFFFQERLVEEYSLKKPSKTRVIEKAKKINGFDYPIVSEFLERTFKPYSIDKDNIEIVSKQFVNPISNLGQLHYRFLLIDTVDVSERRCFKILFKPSRKGDLAFFGEVYIDEQQFNVRKIRFEVGSEVNINFINKMVLEKEFDFFEDSIYYLTRDYAEVDMSLTEKQNGIITKKEVLYYDFEFNNPKPIAFYSEKEGFKNPQKLLKQNDYWKKSRPIKLTDKQLKVMSLTDTLSNSKRYKTINALIRLGFLGFIEYGAIDIGNILTFMSYNGVEGLRLQFGMRNSEKLFDRGFLHSYIGYGTRDKRFKYGISGQYVFNKNKWSSLEFRFIDDYFKIGHVRFILPPQHFIFSFRGFYKLNENRVITHVKNQSLSFNHDFYRDLRGGIEIETKHYSPAGNDYKYYKPNFTNQRNKNFLFTGFRSSEVHLKLRYSPKIEVFYRSFFRKYRPTYQPIFHLDISGKHISGEKKFNALNIGFGFSKRFKVSSFGVSTFLAEAKHFIGKAPYPFLNIVGHNESMFESRRYFNLTDQYEFIGNSSVFLSYTHGFEGFFFNKIPLFRKLKWREFAFIKTQIISLNDANNNIEGKNADLPYFHPNTRLMNNGPYTEFGAGVENIFRFFRVYFVTRPTYRKEKLSDNFAIRFGYELKF